jgi:hypothetical protein
MIGGVVELGAAARSPSFWCLNLSSNRYMRPDRAL